MNDENTQTPETPGTSAPEPKPAAAAMEPSPTPNSETPVSPPQQPQSESEGNAGGGDRTVELVGIDSFVNGELPEPSPHVVGDLPRETESRQESRQLAQLKGIEKTEKGLRDNSGRYFDPEKHQHRAGVPKTSEKGYFRPWGRIHKKAGLHLKPEGFGSQDDEDSEEETSLFEKAKRFFVGETRPEPTKQHERREPAQEQAPQPAPPPNNGLIGIPQPSREPETGKRDSEAATAAAQLVAMEEMVAVMVFSEEWQFLSEERKGLIMAWTRAFEEKGVVETPWWMELGAAHAVIIANRADKPKTREKLGKMKARFMKKIIDLRTAKAPAQVDERKGAK